MLETLDEPTPFPTMIFMDPPEHGELRKLVSLARFPEWEIDESELEMVRTTTVRGYSSVPFHL
jgi:hypothetical protein